MVKDTNMRMSAQSIGNFGSTPSFLVYIYGEWAHTLSLTRPKASRRV